MQKGDKAALAHQVRVELALFLTLFHEKAHKPGGDCPTLTSREMLDVLAPALGDLVADVSGSSAVALGIEAAKVDELVRKYARDSFNLRIARGSI